MTDYWLMLSAFSVGAGVGAIAGFLLCAIFVAGSKADKEAEIDFWRSEALKRVSRNIGGQEN